jgi:alcohol-forming fatty acyl-CoA reductase
MEQQRNDLNIREFYRNKTILVTGTTGFVGKVILEKLLRSCSDFKRIYLMVRPRPNMTLAARIQRDIYSSPLLTNLFNEKPETMKLAKEKVVPIEGDLVLKGLGFKPEDRANLIEEVEVILNSAASVNFMEPLRDAL